MKKIIIEKDVYKYEELNEEAKENVKNWLLDAFRDEEVFAQDCLEVMRAEYGFNNLDINYRLSYCQGDGLSFTGRVSIYDFITNPLNRERLEKNFTQKELKTLYFLANTMELGSIIIDRTNYRYYHKDSVSFNYEYEIGDYLRGKEKLEEVAEKFLNYIIDLFDNECDKLEEAGYNYFYEISEEEAKEICFCNGYEFFEDGEFYN